MRLCSLLSSVAKKMTEKINYPSAERNKVYILDVLKKHFDSSRPGDVLEIASGTGQHAAHFAKHFQNLTFQPTEYEDALFRSIQAYAADAFPKKNIRQPILVDVSNDCDGWKLPLKRYDYMININMIHISPIECTEGLFRSAGKLLKPKGGLMATYGPYAEDGVIKPESNVDFDEDLKRRNPSWGLRDIDDLKKIAKENGIELIDKCDMPSNNKCLVWMKL
ncbi:PREDICTED: UPF0585 protein CG18661 [Nicrophorus vespilloides]|uniref:UPF0585 protein CG18661 n=1 Tax=Nicrophorus vespilloides TaxID=110193 RepID=A0ABM1M1R2_NICVS|nr:PREDICTED: UPF0585 protein CG18661 [Nicrophorus vespilloides]